MFKVFLNVRTLVNNNPKNSKVSKYSKTAYSLQEGDAVPEHLTKVTHCKYNLLHFLLLLLFFLYN